LWGKLRQYNPVYRNMELDENAVDALRIASVNNEDAMEEVTVLQDAILVSGTSCANNNEGAETMELVEERGPVFEAVTNSDETPSTSSFFDEGVWRAEGGSGGAREDGEEQAEEDPMELDEEVIANDNPATGTGGGGEEGVSRASYITMTEDVRSEVERQHDATSSFVYRPGNEPVPAYDRRLLTSIYPGLFPFGRGGPDESRAVAVSQEKCVAHYLKLSTRQFATHPEFLIERFDTREKSEAIRNTCMSVKYNPRDQEAINTVTPSQVIVV